MLGDAGCAGHAVPDSHATNEPQGSLATAKAGEDGTTARGEATFVYSPPIHTRTLTTTRVYNTILLFAPLCLSLDHATLHVSLPCFFFSGPFPPISLTLLAPSCCRTLLTFLCDCCLFRYVEKMEEKLARQDDKRNASGANASPLNPRQRLLLEAHKQWASHDDVRLNHQQQQQQRQRHQVVEQPRQQGQGQGSGQPRLEQGQRQRQGQGQQGGGQSMTLLDSRAFSSHADISRHGHALLSAGQQVTPLDEHDLPVVEFFVCHPPHPFPSSSCSLLPYPP